MDKRKKVCVVTYCEWSSYGSVLQTIGMRSAISKLGAESFVLKDNPAPLSTMSFGFKISKNIKTLIKNLLKVRIKNKIENQYQKSVEFINKNVDIKYYDSYEVLKAHPPKADIYIAGSDQIWHPNLCKPLFFLEFLPENAKKYSYAASMGVTEVPCEKEEKFKKLVSSFDTYSVRESEMIEVLSRYTDKSILHHIDPSFFIDKDGWGIYEKEYSITKPYILVFAIYWDKKLNKKLKLLHKKTGKEIVVISSTINRVWGNRKIYDADCGNFLYLIHNADAVVSSSFHGVALSLNYNKKLSVVVNPNAPSRLNSIMNKVGFKNVEIENLMDFDLGQYDQINLKIQEEKQKGIGYLKGILSNE